jgi:hypothetical protein
VLNKQVVALSFAFKKINPATSFGSREDKSVVQSTERKPYREWLKNVQSDYLHIRYGIPFL